MRSLFALICCLAFVPAGTLAAEEAIYKCQDSSGTVVFSDKPCGAAQDMQRISLDVDAQAAQAGAATVGLCQQENEARADLATLDQELGALPSSQRRLVRQVLTEYRAGPAGSGPRWGRAGDQAIHLCLPTVAGEMVEHIATTQGKLLQLKGGLLSYRNDAQTPQALRERCREVWTQCLLVQTEDDSECLTQVATCPAREPWEGGRNCCPLECKEQYRARRSRGEASASILMSILDDSPSCVPGLRGR